MKTQPSAPRADRHQRRDRHDDLRPRRTSMFVLVVIFLVLVGTAVWAIDYYAGCQRAPEGPQEPLA